MRHRYRYTDFRGRSVPPEKAKNVEVIFTETINGEEYEISYHRQVADLQDGWTASLSRRATKVFDEIREETTDRRRRP